MSARAASVGSSWNSFRRSIPPWAWGVLWIGLAILYPYITDSIDLPILGGHDDLLDASIQTLGYIIMALGLNIVVGMAGLLDLGYVAFYAIGAFVIGWLGSQQFPDVNHGKGIHVGVTGVGATGVGVTGAGAWHATTNSMSATHHRERRMSQPSTVLGSRPSPWSKPISATS